MVLDGVLLASPYVAGPGDCLLAPAGGGRFQDDGDCREGINNSEKTDPCQKERACCQSRTSCGPSRPSLHSPPGRRCPGAGHRLAQPYFSMVDFMYHKFGQVVAWYLAVKAGPGSGPGAVLAGRGRGTHRDGSRTTTIWKVVSVQ